MRRHFYVNSDTFIYKLKAGSLLMKNEIWKKNYFVNEKNIYFHINVVL